MLLHLGGDWAANSRRIIAILDYGSVAGSRATKRILAQAERQKLLERIDADAGTRSIVLMDAGRSTRVMLSPISAAALKGRLQSNALYLDFNGGAAAATPARADRKGR
jgi:regulator of extracellular matrix RemA (YlzA/DUF370 family)